MFSKIYVFDFFSKNEQYQRSLNNFENNALKVERVQKTFEILILLR